MTEEETRLCENSERHIKLNEIDKIWNQASDLRNDVMHFGFRANALPSKRILEQAEELAKRVKKIDL